MHYPSFPFITSMTQKLSIMPLSQIGNDLYHCVQRYHGWVRYVIIFVNHCHLRPDCDFHMLMEEPSCHHA